MKNKFIEKQLDLYAESIKPDKQILSDAFYAMRNKSASKAIKRQKWFKAAIAVSAVAVCSIIIFFIIQLNQKPGIGIKNYSLAELTYQTKTAEDIYNNSNILILKSGKFTVNYRMYYSDDKTKPIVITSYYKILDEHGVDEILVVADLSNALTDYENFKDYMKYTIQNIQVSKNEIKEHGEYYTSIYFTYDNYSYYIKIASPIANSANSYINQLISGE